MHYCVSRKRKVRILQMLEQSNLIIPLYHFLFVLSSMGRALGGNGGWPPKKISGVDGSCIRPPNILKSNVIGYVRKCKLSKKGVIKEFFV